MCLHRRQQHKTGVCHTHTEEPGGGRIATCAPERHDHTVGGAFAEGAEFFGGHMQQFTHSLLQLSRRELGVGAQKILDLLCMLLPTLLHTLALPRGQAARGVVMTNSICDERETVLSV